MSSAATTASNDRKATNKPDGKSNKSNNRRLDGVVREVELRTGPNGGVYYVKNGKKVYVKTIMLHGGKGDDSKKRGPR